MEPKDRLIHFRLYEGGGRVRACDILRQQYKIYGFAALGIWMKE